MMGYLIQIMELLQADGLDCDYAFPFDRMPPLQEPVLRVISSDVSVSVLSPDQLLGSLNGASISAMRYDETVDIDIFSPYLFGGTRCDLFAKRVLQVAMRAFDTCPVKSIHREASYYDPKTDCFRCKIKVVLQAWISKSGG